MGLLSVLYLALSCRHQASTEAFQMPIEDTVCLGETTIGISTIASHLNVPWEITWGPDSTLWFTEQSGTISKVNPHTGVVKLLLRIPEVYRERTLGLLGMAVSLDKTKPYVFVDYTHKKDSGAVVSKLVRYTYGKDSLRDPLLLLEVPAGTGHNGSRVTLSPDGKVFWAVGDIADNNNAQDTASLNGKILRLNMDGTIPADNPFGRSPVWSMGHRNIQGLVFSPDGALLSSEHGDATDDEINLIEKGGNYGWPIIMGYADQPKEKRYQQDHLCLDPLIAWTPTIAPSGIGYYNSDQIPEWKHAILLATLKGVSLHVLKREDHPGAKLSDKRYFVDYFGRLRDVCVSPEGDVYLSTSNRDWNPLGKPRPEDDRIIRLAKISKDDDLSHLEVASASDIPDKTGPAPDAAVVLYKNYCASCHKVDGKGVPGTFPALAGSSMVTGEPGPLLKFVLKGGLAAGASAAPAGENMPAFDFLKDQQVAAILSYVRHRWGNDADPISVDQVKAARAQQQ